MSELETGAAPAAPEAAVIDTAPPPAGGPPTEPAAPSMDDTLRAVYRKQQVNGVDRGEDGRFKSDTPADPPQQELAAQPPKEAVEPPLAEPVKVIDPPNSWAADARAHWAKLPPEAQEYILKREGEAHKAITSQGERLKSYEPLEKVITQFKSDFERRGLTAERAFSTLLEAQQMLDRNPLDGLISIARSYGIDLGALLNGQQGSLPDPRVGQVEQKLNQLQQTIEQQRQQQEQSHLTEVNALIESFKKDHPHYEAIEDEMTGLIPVLRQRNPGLSQKELLEKAYDAATFANPEIRKLIQEEQRIAEDNKRKELAEKAEAEAKEKAEEAKKAAKLNVKGSVAHTTPKSMDDTIREVARRAYRG